MSEQCFYNLNGPGFIKSLEEPAEIIKAWYRLDQKTLLVTFCRTQGDGKPAIVDITVQTAQIGIGDPTDNATGPVASATAGPVNPDESFPIALSLADPKVATLLNGRASCQTVCEFKITSSTGRDRYQCPINIIEPLLDDAVADPPVAQRALGNLEAMGLFVTRAALPGEGKIWSSQTPGSTKKFNMYFTDDGIQIDPLP